MTGSATSDMATLRIDGELTIYRAAELCDVLKEIGRASCRERV